MSECTGLDKNVECSTCKHSIHGTLTFDLWSLVGPGLKVCHLLCGLVLVLVLKHFSHIILIIMV